MSAAVRGSASIERLVRLGAESGRGTLRLARSADNDHRWARRKIENMPGLIYTERLSHADRCEVCDTSSSGALLNIDTASQPSVATVDEVPDRFVLIIHRYRERSEVACVVVRRQGSQIGVRFVSQFVTTINLARPLQARKPKA